MDFQPYIHEFHHWWQDVEIWFSTYTTAMDFSTLLICFAVFIISAIVVYMISVFGIRERTYEEAIEEQKRRNQEALQQAKAEKAKKDKKFKKWGKKSKEKNEEEKNNMEDNEIHKIHQQIEIKANLENHAVNNSNKISENKSLNQKKKNKQTKAISTEKEGYLPRSSSEETEESSSISTPSCGMQSHDVDNRRNGLIEGNHCVEKVFENQNVKNTQGYQNDIKETMASQGDMTLIKPSKKSPSMKAKKEGMKYIDQDLNDGNNKIISIIKATELEEEEIKFVLDAINAKKKGIANEKKKNDTIVSLQKQVQEKEEILKNEKKACNAANEKIKDLIKELNEEKARASASEKSLREALNHEKQELKVAHGMIQHKREQHASEIASLQSNMQQMKKQLKEEHALTMQRLKEENNQLQTINRVESDKQQRNNIEISRLQHELEQMRSACEKYETHQAAMQQSQEDLQHQIQQLEKHIEQLVNSHQEEEYNYKQKINEMSNKLQHAENARSSLMQDLQNAQSICSSLESDNSSLRQKLEESKHQLKVAEKETLQYQAKFKELNEKNLELTESLIVTENKLQDLSKTSEIRIQEAQMKADTHAKEMQNILNEQIKEVEKALQESYSQEIELAQQEVAKAHQEAEEKINKLQSETSIRVEELQESLYRRLNEVNNENDLKIKAVLAEKEEMKKDMEELCYTVKNTVKKIFPNIHIDENLDMKAWLNDGEQKAKEYIETLKPELIENNSSDEVQAVKDKLEQILNEKSNLELQVIKYQGILNQTELILTNLQNNVEKEEIKWKDLLLTKEEELKEALCKKEKLEKQNQNLEAKLQNLLANKEDIIEKE